MNIDAAKYDEKLIDELIVAARHVGILEAWDDRHNDGTRVPPKLQAARDKLDRIRGSLLKERTAPQKVEPDPTPFRLRVMMADYEFLVSCARQDVERYGSYSCDYSSMLRLLKVDIERQLGRPIYDEPTLLPEHGPEQDGVPF